MNLTIELEELLKSSGADLVGFADLSGIAYDEMNYGVSVAVAIPEWIVTSIADGPNMDYFNAYHELNDKLNRIVTSGADFLQKKGFQAFAQTTDAVQEFDVFRTKLPHKTVAVRSGLGWIGKSALFVCDKYGSAVRLSSLVTNAGLECGTAVTHSKCGDCLICKSACPANAISGELWSADADRDEFFNPIACRTEARRLAAERINRAITLCGKCIEVCPHTQKYLRSVRNINH